MAEITKIVPCIPTDKVMTVGEMREFLAHLPSDVELFVQIKMNDDTGYFPVEDIKTETEPVILLCGDEVIMLVEED